jgi:hypothetical protein
LAAGALPALAGVPRSGRRGVRGLGNEAGGPMRVRVVDRRRCTDVAGAARVPRPCREDRPQLRLAGATACSRVREPVAPGWFALKDLAGYKAAPRGRGRRGRAGAAGAGSRPAHDVAEFAALRGVTAGTRRRVRRTVAARLGVPRARNRAGARRNPAGPTRPFLPVAARPGCGVDIRDPAGTQFRSATGPAADPGRPRPAARLAWRRPAGQPRARRARSVQVTVAQPLLRQRQIRLTHTSTAGRPDTATSRTRCSRRACAAACRPHRPKLACLGC